MVRTTSHIDVGDFGVLLRDWRTYVVSVIGAFVLIQQDFATYVPYGPELLEVFKWLGLGIVVIFFSDVALKALANFIPTNYVPPADKVVLITGCDSGFGFNLTKSLDKLGFTVYAGCLFPDGTGAQQLREKCSEKLKVVPLDVTSDESVQSVKKEILASIGDKHLWAVVNNAGIATVGNVEWSSLSDCKKVMEVNSFGVVRVTQAFLPMLRRSRGRVVIVASIAGRISTAGMAPYSMSKFAAVAFADALRREMKEWGVTVHTIEPTFYKTPIMDWKKNRGTIEDVWNNAPDEVKEEYGEEYIANYITAAAKIHWLCLKNLNEVLYCMQDAVHSTDPKMRYIPNTGFEIVFRLCNLLPVSFLDFLMNYFTPKSKMSKTFYKKYEKLEDDTPRRVSSLSSYR